MRAPLARFRCPALAVALGLHSLLCACSAGVSYVTVPMTRLAASADAGAADLADAAPGRLTSRALPVEPMPSDPTVPCRRDVACEPEADVSTLARAFPPPFERCPELGRTGEAFSPRETRDARRADAHACCYVGFSGCSKSGSRG